MQTDKINQTGTSSNSDSLKNMDEQSGKPTDGSQAYIDTDTDAAAAKPGHPSKENSGNERESED